MNRKGFSELLLLMILTGVLALGVPIIFKHLAPRQQAAAPVVPTTIPTATTTQPVEAPPQPATATVRVPDGSMSQFPFASLDGKYVFILYAPQDGVNCIYRVTDNKNHEIVLDKVVNSYDINCSIGLGFDSDFKGWADGDKFLLKSNPGEVKIVNVKNLSVETHKYDSSNYYFDAANRSLKYWLFQHDEGGGDYTILDESNNVILAKIRGYGSALYEPVNDGFVFSASDSVTSSTRSLRLDYLPAGALKIQNIFVSDPFEPAQRGSEPPSVSGKPGEISYSPGFGGIDIKYFDLKDVSIHIKLPKPTLPTSTSISWSEAMPFINACQVQYIGYPYNCCGDVHGPSIVFKNGRSLNLASLPADATDIVASVSSTCGAIRFLPGPICECIP